MIKKHLIWDLPTRIFHWCFVLTILGAWYTSENKDDYIELHMQLGFIAIGLIIFRIAWGIVGPKHARFSQFIPSPKTLFNYLKQSDKTKKIPGHNPLGALMVILMLLLIIIQVTSGLFIDDTVFSSGPYFGAISNDLEKVMRFLHHNTFNFMIAAIFLHVSAISYYWIFKKDNLVLPMFSGKKTQAQVNESDAIPHSKIILAIIIAVISAAFVYWLVVINAPVIEEFFY